MVIGYLGIGVQERTHILNFTDGFKIYAPHFSLGYVDRVNLVGTSSDLS